MRQCRIEGEESTGDMSLFADDAELAISIDPIDGTTSFLTDLGLPQDLSSAVIAMVVVSFALTTLDSATRLLRFNIEEIGRALKVPFVGNRYLAAFLACLTIVFFNHPLSAVALTLFLGLTSGSGQTLVGAAWPEFYGALNLGAIRAMVISMSVGASALSPFVLGWLIDRGASMESMAVGFLVYLALAIAGIMAALALPVPDTMKETRA